jgi:Ni/Fe-hydrogenase subunit HybB-like protein
MLVKRVLLVLPAHYVAHLPAPRPLVEYVPTVTEISTTLGSYAFAVLLFLALVRWVPLIEVSEDLRSSGGNWTARPLRSRAVLRAGIVIATLAMAAFLITWGIVTREHDLAPMKWLAGIALLVAIPLEICLIRDATATEPTES